MNTPCYYGSIGIMNAPHMYRSRRRQGPLGRTGDLLAAVFERWSDWRERAGARRRLAQLDDRLLTDIGLCRTELASELAKPFWR